MKPQDGLFHSSGLHSVVAVWRLTRTGAVSHLREASAGLSHERAQAPEVQGPWARRRASAHFAALLKDVVPRAWLQPETLKEAS